jgi:bifunctional non-homologous end joining protein LigD
MAKTSNIQTGQTKRSRGRDLLSVASLPEARKADQPFFSPQLATLAKEVPAGDNWIHEIKYDGYRMAALCLTARSG